MERAGKGVMGSVWDTELSAAYVLMYASEKHGPDLRSGEREGVQSWVRKTVNDSQGAVRPTAHLAMNPPLGSPRCPVGLEQVEGRRRRKKAKETCGKGFRGMSTCRECSFMLTPPSATRPQKL
ncbi:hypothetical protein AGOR_G00154990 [Albula goreensis]|uniref:Uncharacterized protein n=1 Tax=Albula goreensis TaxID=1534307 RepID=A0A8T3D7E8_9TELE|nr:hypothetical protein AGOR_G00154990 [Albula goreensis]